jgi:hypothetical protein
MPEQEIPVLKGLEERVIDLEAAVAELQQLIGG